MTVFFGRCLIAMGVLVAVLCGLCTVTMLAPWLAGHVKPSRSLFAVNNAQGAVFVLIFGGVPAVVGAALAALGVAMARNPGKRRLVSSVLLGLLSIPFLLNGGGMLIGTLAALGRPADYAGEFTLPFVMGLIVTGIGAVLFGAAISVFVKREAST